MDFFRKLKIRKIIIPGIFLAVLAFSFGAYRIIATENTNIDSTSKYAWSENGGWLNFRSDGTEVTIADDKITGYVWSENLGWISLHCENDDSCAAVDFGVANDGEGVLTGYAWGENIGWVNFAPTNGGVSIDTNGNFLGLAWGENIGWVIFNCSDVDACDSSAFRVKTSWRPLSARDNDDEDEEEAGSLEISNVKYSSTDSTIVITWKTNHNADSFVRWGADKNLKEERKDNENVRSHRVVLRNLTPETEYYFRVKSTDGNEKSDSSRIHSVSTKQTSSFFEKSLWKSSDSPAKEDDYEKVEIEVSDKEEPVEQEKDSEKDEIAETDIPVQIDKSGPGAFSRFFAAAKSGVSGFFSGARSLALSGQRKIARIFSRTGEGLASAYGFAVSRFNREKAAEIARFNRAKFFTTEVFKRDELKILAEVRFQILDKAESPIPELETMLFSDPQSSVTDENGIASFRDVPVGSHTLAFDYQNEKFEKKVAISDTLTEEGQVRMEVAQVKAEKEKVALWMWLVMLMLIFAIALAVYFAGKYYKLKKAQLGRPLSE